MQVVALVHVAVQAETSAEKTTSVENKVENGISIVATRKRMKKKQHKQ